MLKQNKNVIIDSTCNYPNVLNRGIELAANYSAEYRYVECRVTVEDLEELERRIAGRMPLRSQRRGVMKPPPDASSAATHDEEGYRKLFKRWIEEPCRPESGCIVVDSRELSPEECAEIVLKDIGSLASVCEKQSPL